MLNVKVKKLCEGAILPRYGSSGAAGADLFAKIEEGELVIPPQTTKFIRTGISIELPEGTVGLIYARSGLASKQDLAPANKVGVIDSDYRGEILVALFNHGALPRTIQDGERIAQLVICPFYRASFSEGELSVSERGAGGFGSTGSL